MQSYFAIETEAEYRRREWERAVAANARAAQAQAANGRAGWRQLPQIALASLRSLSAPRLTLTSSLKPDSPTPAC